MTVHPTSGQGSGTIAITVEANARPSARSTALAVNDARVTISQEPAPCRFELGGQSTRVGSEGGRATVRVSTIDGCEWRASGSTDWARIVTDRGTGSGSVEIDVGRNHGSERSVTLSIAGSSFVITQDAASEGPSAPPSDPPPAPVSCSFAIDPERASVRAGAATLAVRVITGPGCEWTADSATGWITLPRAAGAGPDTVTYRVAANLSTVSDRSGSVVVAGRIHRVTQQACDLSLESGFPNLPPSAGTYNFRVTTDPSCTWSASSTVDWISLVTPSGAGSGSVTYRLAPNPIARDRSGAVVVSGRTKIITQQALGQS